MNASGGGNLLAKAMKDSARGDRDGRKRGVHEEAAEETVATEKRARVEDRLSVGRTDVHKDEVEEPVATETQERVEDRLSSGDQAKSRLSVKDRLGARPYSPPPVAHESAKRMPMCRFDGVCTRPTCAYKHSPTAKAAAAVVIAKPVPAFGPKVTMRDGAGAARLMTLAGPLASPLKPPLFGCLPIILPPLP